MGGNNDIGDATKKVVEGLCKWLNGPDATATPSTRSTVWHAISSFLRSRWQGASSFLTFLLWFAGVFLHVAHLKEQRDPHQVDGLSQAFLIVFFLAPVAQVIVLQFLKSGGVTRLFTLLMLTSTVPYLILWLFFTFQLEPAPLFTFAVFAIGWSAVILAGAAFVTYVILAADIGQQCSDLREGLRQHRFATLCFFFATFLCVTYTLALGVGFQDRWHRKEHSKGALFTNTAHTDPTIATDAKQAPTDPPTETLPPPPLPSGTAATSSGPTPKPGASGTSAESQPSPPLVKVLPPICKVLAEFADKDPEKFSMTEVLPHQEGEDADAPKPTRVGPENTPQKRAHFLERVVACIEQMGWKVRLVFAAKGAKPGPPLGDTRDTSRAAQYQLSNSRVDQFIREVRTQLLAKETSKLSDVHWETYGTTDRNATVELDVEPVKAPSATDEWRADIGRIVDVKGELVGVKENLTNGLEKVQKSLVQLQPSPHDEKRPLGLVNYLYFMTYTITTTGYGDIMPVSGLAKMTVTLANFYEVFFLVIFFNVLLSLSGGKRNADGKSEPSAGPGHCRRRGIRTRLKAGSRCPRVPEPDPPKQAEGQGDSHQAVPSPIAATDNKPPAQPALRIASVPPSGGTKKR